MTRAPACATVIDEFFTAYYRHRPVSATFIGVHEYDDRLPDYSERGVADVAAAMDGILRRLRALPEPPSESEALDRILLGGFLEIQQWESASPHFARENPCVYTGEAVFGTIALFLRDFAPVAQRVEAAIARMHAVPRLLAEGKANLRVAPRAWVERAIRECAGAQGFFRDGLEILIRDLAISDPRLRSAAAAAAAAVADFQTYLASELAPRAHDHYACGEAALELLIRRGHFLKTGAAAVREAARDRLAACEEELAMRARGFGAASWRDALAQLAATHPAPGEYCARYAEVWEAARAAALAHDLVTWPAYPIRYVPRPAWARQAASHLYFLAYRSPAPYDRLPVVEYLVPPIDGDETPDERVRRLRATNDSVIKLNHVIHHGGLGHHVQNWYASHAASRVGRVAAVDCASRIAVFCGGTMAEGWACYAVDLMDEIGFLTPLEHYAQIHAHLRLAARAFVDVELHCGRLSLEGAAAFYETRAGLSPEAARAEAVKNSMFPGTAMMYMVGTDLIHQLRRDMAGRARGTFDLRGFHDRLLSYGSIPVALAGAAMRTPHTAVERRVGRRV
jgi:hypothetical protein